MPRDLAPTPTCGKPTGFCMNRRHFIAAGAAGTTVLLGRLFPGRVFAEDENRTATLATYPRKKIAKLAELRTDEPIYFSYPADGLHMSAMLVKLGRAAGGGVGPQQDIVAFSTVCTHMGGDLTGTYHKEYKVAGPCPDHLTSFDLTRHGIVVAGHATASLPQIVLELDGNDVYAVGVLGLIYGYASNVAT